MHHCIRHIHDLTNIFLEQNKKTNPKFSMNIIAFCSFVFLCVCALEMYATGCPPYELCNEEHVTKLISSGISALLANLPEIDC